MAENNKAIKLYTGDVVAATSSKGNQENGMMRRQTAGISWIAPALKHWQRQSQASFCKNTAISKQSLAIKS